MARRLHPDERALWGKVAATVTPLAPAPVAPPAPAPPLGAAASAHPQPAPVKGRRPPAPRQPAAPLVSGAGGRRAAFARATLDSHWDRRLRKGLVRPDISIDLHGHSLASAHALLEDSLARAVQRGARVMLVVAGRVRPGPHHPPLHGDPRPRGAIRAALPDWLAASDRAHAILATRPAAPAHGGSGAIYVVLRRSGD